MPAQGQPRRPLVPASLPSRRRTAPRRKIARPALEPLESRVALSLLTVTSADDAGAGSLRATLASAQAGDTIEFAPSLDGQTIHLTSGELAIDEDLTIQGPGADRLDVDAGGLSRVFDITTADVAISGLTISGGLAHVGGGILAGANSHVGGGILAQGGSLSLTGDVVTDNRAGSDDLYLAPAQGGGVAVIGGGALTAKGTTFQGNLAQGAAGADIGEFGGAGQGGAIYFDGSRLSLSGGGVLDNRAVGGLGGSAGVTGFNKFYRIGLGGNGVGGGIYVRGGALTIAGSSFAGNLAQGGQGGDGGNGFENGFGGYGVGGAVYGAGDSADISASLFRSNRAVGGRGGAGGAGAGAVYTSSSSSSNVSYRYNDFGGGGTGGGLYLASGALTVAESTFEDNAALGGDGGQAAGTPYSQNGAAGDGSGGAVQITSNSANAGPLAFVNDTFRGSLATGGQGTGGGSNGGGNAGAIGGGGFGRPMSVSGCLFDANRVLSPTRPGDYSSGAAIDTYSALDVLNSKFTNNSATGGYVLGGVIYSEDPTVRGSTFAGNVTTGLAVDGGVIYASHRLTVDGSTFSGNQAIGIRGPDGQGPSQGAGGVVGGGVILSTLFTITDSTFTSNRAQGGDGGDGGPGSAGATGGAVVGGVIGTTAMYPPNGRGRGIAPSLTPNMVIAGCRFVDNSAVAGSGGAGGAGANGGAGGYVQGVDVSLPRQGSITDSQFTGAAATGGRGGRGGDGGGNGGAGGDVLGGSLALQDDWDVLSYINNPTDFVRNISITGVTARGGDGGDGGSGGDGGAGGAALGGGILLDVTQEAVFNDSTLDYQLTLTDSRITGNTARGGDGGAGGAGGDGGAGGAAQGGGVAVRGTAVGEYGTATLNIDATIASTRITGNTAQGGAGGAGATGGAGGNAQGGGLFLGGRVREFNGTGIPAIRATITDNSLSGNTAQGGDGGLGSTGGAGGSAQGGGLFADDHSTVALSGTSITGNKARGGAGGKGAVRGVAGAGVGGGGYLSAPGSTRVNTKIIGNSASTSDDDIFGSFS